MRFPNAAKGLKSLLTAELLELFAVVFFSVIATVDASEAVVLIVVILCIAALVAALILSFKGLKLASQDDEKFKLAYELNLGMLIAEILFMLFGLLSDVWSFFSVFKSSSSLTMVFSLIANVSVTLGIQNVFERLRNEKMVNRARRATIVTVINGVLDLMANTICLSLLANAEVVVLLVLILAFVIFSLVAYIMYLTLLSKTVKELA